MGSSEPLSSTRSVDMNLGRSFKAGKGQQTVRVA
jgi:hypothetical protein